MQVTVGRIGRPHGIRGDVVVGVRTDEPEARFAVGARLGTDPPAIGPLTVAAVRWQSGELIVRFKGIKDRTAASELGGTWLIIDAAALSPLDDPDEFRDHDLVGLTVRTTAGAVVGEVTDVLHHGQDLLVIKPDSAGRPVAGRPVAGRPVAGRPGAGPSGTGPGSAGADILVPFVKAIVTEVDLAGGVLVIDPPPGLLNLDEAQ
jgi:16S rRNA processing protein RimM